jgi:hypothetical protein
LSFPPEGRVAGIFDAWNRRAPRVGDLAFAAFWLALASGALLAVSYSAGAASDSLQRLLLVDAAGTFVRSLHYWSAQTFLVATALHLVEHLARRNETRVRLGVWLRLVLVTVVVVYLMVSGYVLKGDAGGKLAGQVLAGLLHRVPLLGPALAALLVGSDESLGVLYVQHAATASLVTFVFIFEHYRRAWPRPAAWLWTLGANAALAVARVPALLDPLAPPRKGPWYMLGLQELLHWLPSPGLAWVPLLAAPVLLACLPLLPPLRALRVKKGLGAALAVYGVLAGVGYFFRGENWTWTPAASGSGGFTDLRVFFPDRWRPGQIRRSSSGAARGAWSATRKPVVSTVPTARRPWAAPRATSGRPGPPTRTWRIPAWCACRATSPSRARRAARPLATGLS